ncbi:MAG TPA: hypothetical protein PL029_01720 [Bacteroidia bacterium]|nr:hypothetical protein [Bacteroidia bacterium]
MKLITYLLIALFAFQNPFFAQDQSMFKQKKERKKLWRRWNPRREAYNPYLKKKNKDKPSVQMARSNKKDLRRQKRMFKKQTKRGKRNTRRNAS